MDDRTRKQDRSTSFGLEPKFDGKTPKDDNSIYTFLFARQFQLGFALRPWPKVSDIFVEPWRTSCDYARPGNYWKCKDFMKVLKDW